MTLLELLKLMRKHLKLVVALPIVCAIAMGLVSFLFMPNTYTASTSMYVLVQSDNTTGATMSTDLSASQMITNDVANLITSDRVTKDTAAALQMNSLDDYDIAVNSETTTRVLTLSVTGQDAQSTAIIANELAKNVSAVAQEVMNVQSVNVIDEAATPESPSGPNRMMYTAVAFLAGLFLAVAIVVLMDVLNTRVRGAEDVEELLGVPVIGRIPAMKEGK
ncbi:YveK family protein [uncultured Slackia sp.]|uniref:YveK family protein n=1 Tax=uncultured Slackia sp. TaxID=665903 RepID=UPI0025FFD4EA|nr:Wzz/FepE/Etk N-terminal domain-containing protein [uncultured Slackia sp.]